MRLIFLFAFLFILSGCDVLPAGSVYRSTSSGSGSNERNEFATLMAKDKINKDQVTAEVLT